MATTIKQTTLLNSINNKATTLNLASVTDISAPTNGFMQKLYVIDPGQTKGELMLVNGAAVGTQVPVTRLDGKTPHFGGTLAAGTTGPGSTVLIAPVDPTLGGFYEYDPVGTVGLTGDYPGTPQQTPWVNVVTGDQWLVGSSNIWVPSFNNRSALRGTTAAVASAAGQITPSGPLFHITGNLAITGFVIPTGFTGGYFDVIPDGTFTWTTANNIGLAGTAVVGKILRFLFDTALGQFFPSYVA